MSDALDEDEPEAFSTALLASAQAVIDRQDEAEKRGDEEEEDEEEEERVWSTELVRCIAFLREQQPAQRSQQRALS